jgi:RNA polymerase sigma factor for flagellar operon FliA
MPDPQNPENLFLKNLGWINRVAAMTCSQHGVLGAEAEDFASSIRLKLMEDDYAIIRKHRGEAALTTYLATVVVRQFHNHLREKRGRWRTSAVARRLGPPAPDLESLVFRDGYRLDQAGELLRTSGRTRLSDRELGQLLKELPARQPLRPKEVPGDVLLDQQEAAQHADRGVTDAETGALHDQMTDVLRRAMAQLGAEDQMIVRMHLQDGRTLADVARTLRLEQKPLYRRITRLRASLRAAMEGNGVRGEDVQGLIGGKDHDAQ